MDTPLSQFIHLDCLCGYFRKTGSGALLKTWEVRPGDRRLTSFPPDTILRHDCPKLSVGIQKKSVNHVFIIRDDSCIHKNQS
jgi:hypothetical protein